MTKIIGFSGRKQSGKGTLCEFLVKNAAAVFGRVKEPQDVLPDLGRPPVVKVYSMAGPLKGVCRKVLGLSHTQCYGSDKDKNTTTIYRWCDLPHYPRIIEALRQKVRAELEEKVSTYDWFDRLYHRVMGIDAWVENVVWSRAPTGMMTARQVLQEVGTGIFRQMYANVWNEACLRAIREDAPDVALIDDVRFPDEADAVKGAGGVVIRLTRAPFKGDEHASETAMDQYTGFSRHLANHMLDKTQSCRELLWVLNVLGVVSEDVVGSKSLVGPDGGPLYGRGYFGPSLHDGGFVEGAADPRVVRPDPGRVEVWESAP